MTTYTRILAALAAILFTCALSAESVINGEAINKSIVKIKTSYLVTGQWKEKEDYALIVRDKHDNIDGQYLAIVGQSKVVLMSFSIFIASMFMIFWPTVTVSPGLTSTLRMRPGIGA